ncbi:MAG: 30S ribosomal protein S17e [Thaumarchaeota archaeon]|nr:30S ribosomal protein S17e [Nitrososphaerota archaeon]
MDRTRSLSEQILERHPESFGSDFETNKKALEDLAIIPSKQLRNKMAGYIAKKLKADAVGNEEPSGDDAQE